MNPPPYFAMCNPLNARTRLTDLEDENRRLLLAKSALEERYDSAWKQTTEFHAIAERTAAENTEFRVCKRKLNDELGGALAENLRLQAQAQASDAKRLKAEAETQHANSECRRQANVIRQMEVDASAIRTAAESYKLEKQYLSSSLQNANAKVRGLTAEVLELKAKQSQWSKASKEPKVDPAKALKAGLSEMKAKNEALEEDIRKLKTRATRLDEQSKERASRLAKIAALVQGAGGI
jgi:chromosome segregation ATPase